MENFKRPSPTLDRGFVSTNNEFELAYLRWRYFMKVENPPEELIKKYRYAAFKVAGETYSNNQEQMKLYGLEVEDLKSVSLVYLTSYLGAYSMEHSSDGQDKAKRLGYQESELKRKDLSNMIVFMQQRMKDLTRIFKQKNRNIIGEKTHSRLYQLVDTPIECSDSELVRSPEEFGYRKLTIAQYKEVKKKLGTHPAAGIFSIGGVSYRYVRTTSRTISFWDMDNPKIAAIAGAKDSDVAYQGDLEGIKNRYLIERFLDRYESFSNKGKIRMLNRAMKFFKKKKMKKEFLSAKRLLSKLEA